MVSGSRHVFLNIVRLGLQYCVATAVRVRCLCSTFVYLRHTFLCRLLGGFFYEMACKNWKIEILGVPACHDTRKDTRKETPRHFEVCTAHHTLCVTSRYLRIHPKQGGLWFHTTYSLSSQQVVLVLSYPRIFLIGNPAWHTTKIDIERADTLRVTWFEVYLWTTLTVVKTVRLEIELNLFRASNTSV